MSDTITTFGEYIDNIVDDNEIFSRHMIETGETLRKLEDVRDRASLRQLKKKIVAEQQHKNFRIKQLLWAHNYAYRVVIRQALMAYSRGDLTMSCEELPNVEKHMVSKPELFIDALNAVERMNEEYQLSLSPAAHQVFLIAREKIEEAYQEFKNHSVND